MPYETNGACFLTDMEGCGKVVVLFYKDDCEPCHDLMKELNVMDEEGYLTMMVNMEKNPELALMHKVMHPSTLCLFEGNKRKKKVFAVDAVDNQYIAWDTAAIIDWIEQ